ncbi:MAG: c-type cytochrome [Acidimicrobiia bacterium]|nr:c-type cytochrome [Acidimicrobiia bacterium]
MLAAAWAVLGVLAAMLLLLAPGADAKQKFMSGFGEAFPSAAGSALDSCLLCHTDPMRPGEDNLNQYGEDWENGDFGDKDYRAPALLNRDSDGDGVTNNAEIQQLSLPGDPSSSAPPTTTTTLPGTPPDGQALYAGRCADCHGPNGGDLNGTSLGRSTFISITIDGQGGMPAQNGLTGEQVGAIWDYVTGAAPATTTTTTPGATTTTTVAAAGSVVWAESCAACHGPNGGNVVPASKSRSQLVSEITNGVGTMRGFPELGSVQIGNVADYLLGLSVTTTTTPGATTTTTIARSGRDVYAASCALCHGAEGGDLRGHSLGLSDIVAISTNGSGTMPGYAASLSGEEIANVSAYVASLGANAGVTTTTTAPGTVLFGSTLYMQNCSGCHGLHGEGGPGGPVAATGLSRAAVIAVTRDGTSGMPAYASRLSSGEIASIADHILGMTGSGTTTTVPVDGSEGASPDSTTTTTLDERAEASVTPSGFGSDSGRGLAADLGEPAGEGGLSVGVMAAVFLGVIVAGGAVFAWMRAVRNLVG